MVGPRQRQANQSSTARGTSRRTFFKTLVAGGIASVAARTARAAPRAFIDDVRIISLDHENYHGWPTLTRTDDGTLLLVYSGGREAHVCPFGRVELMRSYDQGETWTWPQVLLDSPIDDRDAGICVTPAGTILVTTFTSLAYVDLLRSSDSWPAEKRSRWLAAHNRVSEPQRKQELGTWIVRSEDGGVSWSARASCPINSPHGPIVLRNGRLLYAGKDLWGGTHRIGVWRSEDDGRSWQPLAMIGARDGDDVQHYHELHAVETVGGRLIVHIRNHNRANEGETLQSESEDGGRSWTTPHPIGVWGLPSHLLRLRDGRLLMTYGYRRPPYGNQARISEDEGRTWSEPIVLSDDGASGDLGYPSTVQLDDGQLVTVWYELRPDSPRAVLRQARWHLA